MIRRYETALSRIRTLAVLIGVLLLAGACSHSGPPLRVMSYNIHIGQGMDKKTDLPRIARVINDAKVDLVAVQEVDRHAQRTGGVDQPAELERLTGMHVAFADAGALRDKGEYGVAILSRWPITQVSRHLLPHGANREPREALAAMIEVPDFGPILVISTHFQHNSEEDRIAEVRSILAMFAERAPPAILAGDLNAAPSSEPLRLLKERWIDASASETRPTSPGDIVPTRIDYVFCRPAKSWRIISATVIDETMASDHRPVVVEIQPRR